MMHTLCRLLAVMAFVLFAPGVQASLIFTFSFDNDPTIGNRGGPIKGEIHGLEIGDIKKPATHVIITEIGPDKTFGHLPLPFDVIGGGWSVGNNEFTVTNGSIISFWHFDVEHKNPSNPPTLLHPGLGISYERLELGTTDSGRPQFWVLLASENRITFSSPDPEFNLLQPAVVPEPSALVLLALGLLGMYSVRARQPAVRPS